ncbi:MAG: hypothetical protein K0Q97_2684 [Bacillota bacterium]|jgi:hypothetical protein|nr:hypothetical protein [Bacillota bacterium]
MTIEYTEQNNENQTAKYREIADFASIILLFSSAIVNTTEEDILLVFASVISLYAGALLIKAAYLEADAQQIAPGVTTTANKLKIIGTTGSLIFSLILFAALLIEVSVKQQATISGQSPISGTVGSLFA